MLLPQIKRGAKVAILFGAGASYGYREQVEENPPLGATLFSRLRKSPLCPTWRVPRITKMFQKIGNFELAMGSLAKEYEWDPMLDDLTFELCQYLAQFSPPPPGRINLYQALLNVVVGKGRICETLLCSLNYETLLEETLIRLPICCITGSPNYALEPAQCTFPLAVPTVLKIHGSINFGMPPGIDMSGAEFHVSPGPGGSARLHTPIHVYDAGEENRKRFSAANGRRFKPYICYYAPGKEPHYNVALKALSGLWAKWLTEDCEAVILIGVNASVADPHLWDPILQSKTIIYYVGSDDAGLKPAGARLITVPGRFPQAIELLTEIL